MAYWHATRPLVSVAALYTHMMKGQIMTECAVQFGRDPPLDQVTTCRRDEQGEIVQLQWNWILESHYIPRLKKKFWELICSASPGAFYYDYAVLDLEIKQVQW